MCKFWTFSDKKRRSSSDQPLDMQIPQKKPRVFFSEEQKDTLRLAYAQDPYPNQSTIECLAAQLSVTPKTIVNWFHNHRMRAKQQQHREGYSPESVGSLKMEPEDFSNHSDHSMSSDTSSQLKSSQNSETSQWMFPSLQPLGSGRRSADVSRDGSATPPINGICVKTEIKTEQGHQQEDSPPHHHLHHPPLIKKSNKRKSAKPQWSYEGTQLDKSRQTIELDNNNFPLQVDAELENAKSSSESTDEEALNRKNNNKTENRDQHTLDKIIEKSSPENGSEKAEEDRNDNIKKMQENLSAKSSSEWEFWNIERSSESKRPSSYSCVTSRRATKSQGWCLGYIVLKPSPCEDWLSGFLYTDITHTHLACRTLSLCIGGKGNQPEQHAFLCTMLKCPACCMCVFGYTSTKALSVQNESLPKRSSSFSPCMQWGHQKGQVSSLLSLFLIKPVLWPQWTSAGPVVRGKSNGPAVAFWSDYASTLLEKKKTQKLLPFPCTPIPPFSPHYPSVVCNASRDGIGAKTCYKKMNYVKETRRTNKTPYCSVISINPRLSWMETSCMYISSIISDRLKNCWWEFIHMVQSACVRSHCVFDDLWPRCKHKLNPNKQTNVGSSDGITTNSHIDLNYCMLAWCRPCFCGKPIFFRRLL